MSGRRGVSTVSYKKLIISTIHIYKILPKIGKIRMGVLLMIYKKIYIKMYKICKKTCPASSRGGGGPPGPPAGPPVAGAGQVPLFDFYLTLF